MSVSQLSLVSCKEPADWNDFVARSPQGSIFCRTEFLKAMDVQYDFWFLTENRKPQAGALIAKDRDGVPAPLQPFALYQGLLYARRDEPPHSRAIWTLEITEVLLKGLVEQYDRLSFCMHYAIEDLRGVQWFHYREPELGQFKIHLRYTGLIDLSAIGDFDLYVKGIRRNRQRDFRKSQTDGLTIEESTDIETLDYLHKLTFERQGLPWEGRHPALLKSISSAALAGGFGKLLLCKTRSGEPCSAHLYLFDDRCGYSLFGASDPKYRNNGSYTYVTLEGVERCRAMGLRTWDFLGINSPQRGDFKTSLNAAPMPYFEAEWARPHHFA